MQKRDDPAPAVARRAEDELLARVRAVLRRPGARLKGETIAFGDIRITLRARQAFKAGREVQLTRKEFDLLRFLGEHRGEVLTRDRLLDERGGAPTAAVWRRKTVRREVSVLEVGNRPVDKRWLTTPPHPLEPWRG